MSDKEPEKRLKGDESGDGDGKMGETAEIETEGKGQTSQPKVVSGLKAVLSKGDFERVVGTRIWVCRRRSRKWSCGRIDSYDCTCKKHFISYEDGETDEIDLTRQEFVLEKYHSVDLQAKSVEPKLTEVARRRKSGNKHEKEKRQQEEEIVKALLTRTPAATFKFLELDKRTSAKVIGKRVKVYSYDEENWLIRRIMSYDESRGRHLVELEDGNATEMDLQSQLCMVELRYEEATTLLNTSSHE